MRKRFLAAWLLTIFILLTGCAGQEGGGRSETPTTEGHVHSFGEWQVVRVSTCVEKGERERVCACGERKTEALAIASHTPEMMAAVDATCTEAGHGEGLCCTVCGDFLSGQSVIPAKGHRLETTPAKAPTCTEAGSSVGAKCGVCGEILAEPTVVPATGHQHVTTPDISPTCQTVGSTGGVHCALCGQVLTAPTVLPTVAHSPVETPAVASTCFSLGSRGGTQCGFCGIVLTESTPVEMVAHTMQGNNCIHCDYQKIRFDDPDLYDSSYGYDFLGTLERGSEMQTLYRRLDEIARKFHTDTTVSATDWVSGKRLRAILPAASYLDLGLTTDDLRLVFSYFHMDRPLYYWMTNYYSNNSKKCTFALQVDAAYADGRDRAYYNKQIYEAIEAYVALVEGETSAYEIALTYHDAILSAVDYLYASDGKTPSEEIYAHRISGVLLEMGAVCESYAQTFQLLLNYSGVENIYVKGTSGGRHAWNLIRLDDGGWYWCDLTWNDTGKEHDGIKYQFFCVGDNEYINWSDARLSRINTLPGSQTFIQTHIPFDMTNEDAWDRVYDLPARAKTVFARSEELELGETFTVDGMTYARWDADEVALVSVSVSAQGALTVPDTVTYRDRSYRVTELCAVDVNGRFHNETPVIDDDDVTALVLPKDLQRLRYRTLAGCEKVTRVTLHGELIHIANDVFSGCTALTEIDYSGTMASWSAIEKAVNWDRGLTSYTIRCSDGVITK